MTLSISDLDTSRASSEAFEFEYVNALGEPSGVFLQVLGSQAEAVTQEVARLVKRTAVAAGVRGDLSEDEREGKFAGHSLRAGLASSAEVDERYVQKQLGHASAEMTRRYQRRRDRFRVNLTKAAGL